jgi:hypothetical protein
MNAPNDQFEDRDPLLEGLFSREHTHLPAEPFSSKTLQAIAAERKRAVWTRRLLQAAGVLALVVVSPALIAGSVWLSARLDEVFALVSSWLATPLGMGAAALVVLAVFVTRRPRVW